MKRQQRLWTALFLALPLTVYLIIVILPLLASFWYSLTDWKFGSEPVFIGLDNYARLIADRNFHTSLKNTLVWMLAALVLPTGGGLVLALLLNERVRGARVFKSLFYLPITISMIVIAQTWEWIYQPRWGLLNNLLEGLHEQWLAWGEPLGIQIPDLSNAWLGDQQTVLAAIIFAWSWQQVGMSMVIFLAGLTSLPDELLEAAQIDGASYLQSLRRIVIPLLLPSSVVVIALAVINSLRSFDIVWVINRGGPVYASTTLAVHMYRETFRSLRAGYGSAISVVLFLVAAVIIVIYFRRVRRLEQMYD